MIWPRVQLGTQDQALDMMVSLVLICVQGWVGQLQHIPEFRQGTSAVNDLTYSVSFTVGIEHTLKLS